MESFYITLPFTADSHLYENTQSHFRVQIPKPLELDGEWQVGLTEIHVPTAWNNIDESTNSFNVHIQKDREQEKREHVIPIPSFSFEGKGSEPFKKFIAHVYAQVPRRFREHIKLFSQTTSANFQAGLIVSAGYEMTFSEKLRGLMGMLEDGVFQVIPLTNESFLLQHSGEEMSMVISELTSATSNATNLTIPHGLYSNADDVLQAMKDVLPDQAKKKILFKHNKDGTISIICANRFSLEFPSTNHGLGSMLGFSMQQTVLTGHTTGKYEADLKRGVHGLYVYADIINPHIVGDSMAPLLRVIPIEGGGSYSYVKIYTNPDFFKLLRNRIESIEIDIRTDSGSRLTFRHGKTLVKLLFRKV